MDEKDELSLENSQQTIGKSELSLENSRRSTTRSEFSLENSRGCNNRCHENAAKYRRNFVSSEFSSKSPKKPGNSFQLLLHNTVYIGDEKIGALALFNRFFSW